MIPVNEPLLAKNTLEYVADCIRTGWVSSAGSYIRRFESEFARMLGVKHAVTTTSGTTALHLALAASGIGPGHEVVIPALTMIAVPYAVLYTGARPVAVDVDPESYNLDPESFAGFIKKTCRYDRRKKALLNRKTGREVKAVCPVHLYGHPCPMDEILGVARDNGLLVIEDAAEAHGALYFSERTPPGLKAGAIGDAGCFSFYANKIITTGEGGMVVTNSDALAEKARRLKDLAHSPDQRFLHTDLAFNFRMTNIQAAIGLAQLEEFDRFLGLKRKMATTYRALLSGVEGLTLPPEKEWAWSVYWMYAILVENEFCLSRDELMNQLREKGVDTRTFFIPVNRQPVFKKMKIFQDRTFPVAEELSRKGLYLPSGLALSDSQMEEVASAIKGIAFDRQ